MQASLLLTMSETSQQYNAVLDTCRNIFLRKNTDYGTSWRLFRPQSITDQIFIKAQRIRNIESNGSNLVGDEIDGELMGIVNYSIIALIQLQLIEEMRETNELEEILELYDYHAHLTRDLMLMKNSDYGEAWREMRTSSFTDMILVKIARIKQIEDNAGKTIASEGRDANYQDIINYAIFALIRLNEK
jgi:Nucleotide modification associated domain 1